eukprot:TRINITY_DN58651_c0_g2_i1.p2 TRINITY_DN58651_c0_g2~~TRINITY_DN58651_c0_g2_i1.p2  ORF type:complete len:114 (-),score=15.26 TRINITY_DN58651_c0_g2_i1:528-869(-)
MDVISVGESGDAGAVAENGWYTFGTNTTVMMMHTTKSPTSDGSVIRQVCTVVKQFATACIASTPTSRKIAWRGSRFNMGSTVQVLLHIMLYAWKASMDQATFKYKRLNDVSAW